MDEFAKLDAAQHVLNFAWAFGGLGWISAFAGLMLGLPMNRLMIGWLAICLIGCVGALVGAVVTYFSS